MPNANTAITDKNKPNVETLPTNNTIISRFPLSPSEKTTKLVIAPAKKKTEEATATQQAARAAIQ